jgi:hypothetical protein
MMSLAPIYLKNLKIINFLKFPPQCFRFKKVGGKHREDERFYMRGDDEPIKTKQTKETEGGGWAGMRTQNNKRERWLVSLFILAIHATLASCRTCVHKHTRRRLRRKKEGRKK